MFSIKKLYENASKKNKLIVFPEAGFSDRTIEAVKIISKKKIARVLLIGDASALVLRDKTLADLEIINPATYDKIDEVANCLYEKRKDKGMTIEEAKELALDPYYFSTLLVEMGIADGMIGGAEVSTARTIKPALQIIKAKSKGDVISSCFLIHGKNKFLKGKTLVVSDAGVCPNPTAEELAVIARESVESYRSLGLTDPRVAFLSYSSKGSAKSEMVDKVRTAFEIFHEQNSDVIADGELQFDAAMVEKVAQLKAPNSPVKGDANILIFPNLETGNITYKAMQYLGGVNAVGPIMQGLRKPVNDLSRGCSVSDIVTLTAITALQCED